jgi:hypothetical protein
MYRGSSGNRGRDRLSRCLRDWIEIKAIEGDEHVSASGVEHAARLPVGAHSVWKEHHPEKAEHQIERSVLERQVLCICWLERHAVRAQMLRRELDNAGIDVGRHDLCFR